MVMNSLNGPPKLQRMPDIGGLSHLSAFARASLNAVGPDRKLLTVTIAIAALSGACQTILLFLLALIGLALSSLSPPPRLPWLSSIPKGATLISLITVSGVLVLAILILALPLARLQASICARAVIRARERMVAAYLDSTFAFRRTLDEGHLQRVIGEYCQYLSNTVQYFTTLCVAGATLLVLIVAPLFVNPKVGGVELMVILASFALYGPVAKRIRRHAVERSAINRGLTTLTAQLARLGDEIETFDVGTSVSLQLNDRVRSAAEALRQITFYDSVVPTVFQFGALALILVGIAVLVTISPGQHPGFAAMALLLLRVLIYGRQVLTILQQGSVLSPYVEFIEADIVNLKANSHSRRGLPGVAFDGLCLRDVVFGYGPGNAVLDRISLDIKPGEAVGIIGSSGGGKSTLCALLLGLRAPDSGSITTGGVAVADISAGDWARIAAYVPQDCKLIAASIADNIRFFRHGHGDLDVEAAARAAHLHDEIMALPEAYRTPVGPGAQDLSGGQRQRLAIARALLDRPQLLVLDEPSSALDQQSEALIGETLAALRGRTTIIVVTHRRPTLRICGRVLQLEDGLLTEIPQSVPSFEKP